MHGHTLEVLQASIDLERDPAAALGDEALAAPVHALLAEPLADELTRGGALRFGALLHDIAKPRTRTELPGGRIGFPHHDEQGAEMARAALSRLRASERLRSHVAALTRHHLRLGFLVHDMPLDRHELYRYLLKTEPVEADVTLLSVADRLATRGRKADEAIATPPRARARRCWPRRSRAVPRGRSRRWCAATSWRPSWASPAARSWAS